MADEEIAVATQVYNLAGPEEERPNYLKTVLFQNLLANRKISLSEAITRSHLNGPGIALRTFYRWAVDNFDDIGMPSGQLAAYVSVDASVVADHIAPPPGETTWVQEVNFGPASYGQWARQYILENIPAELNTDWSSVIDSETDQITITLADGVTTHIFTPTNYDVSSDYIYAYYVTGNVDDAWSSPKIFIYEVGSGIAELDAAVQPIDSYGQFFPMIPVRIRNQFLSTTYLPLQYPTAKKAYKKATGGDFDELVDQIGENDSVGDIDYAYVVFGVTLNTKENSAKKFLYKFFERLQESQVGGPLLYSSWLLSRLGATNAAEAWQLWHDAQSDPGNPLYGTPEPDASFVANPSLPKNIIKIKNNYYFDFQIEWYYITDFSAGGLGKPGAKAGDLWFQYIGIDEMESTFPGYIPMSQARKIRFFWQRSADTYTALDIVGLRHLNYIYKGEFVRTDAGQVVQAMGSPGEKESAFLVPLHYDTLTDMSIIDYTQMSTACVYLVFNAYEVDEIEWWESGIFKIILIVVIAVISVVFTGGAGLGILGAHLAVGSALGFTGLTAAIVGAVANALAAAALTAIIGLAANAVFGDELGSIIGSVLSFFVLQGFTNFAATGSLGFNFAEFMKIDNIMLIMDSVGKGYAAMVAGDIRGMQEELNTYVQEANDTLKEIQEKFNAEFGVGPDYIDPLSFTNAFNSINESGDTFLTRTLLTGSDIAQISNGLVNDFTEMSLALPYAYR